MSYKMSKYLSRKIKFILVFAMGAVVYIHAYNFKDSFLQPTTRISEGFSFAPMLEFFLSNALLRFAVPLFFIASGFLFYFSYENSVNGYGKKLKKRSFSLLLPYLLWTAVSVAFVQFIIRFTPLAGLPIIDEHNLAPEQMWTYLINPPAFQLWYMQQLIIFALLSPVIFLLVEKTRALILIPFAILWLCDLSFIINSEAIFFYSCGAAFAIFDKARNVTHRDDRVMTVIVSVIWAALSLVYTFIAALGDKSVTTTMMMLVLYKVNQIVGLAAMWLIFDHIAKRILNKKGFLLVTAHLFFIYALHEPFLHFATQLALTQNSGSISHLIIYFFLPISTMAACVMLSMILRKICRPLHSALTGGRNT